MLQNTLNAEKFYLAVFNIIIITDVFWAANQNIYIYIYI